MSDEQKLPEEEQKEPISYASPMKRIWAWVGVVYMVIITFLVVYMLAFGAYLGGIGALMVIPALGGVIAASVLLWRQGRNKTFVSRLVLAVIIGLCGALIVLNLWNGIPALIQNFGVRA